MSDRLSDDELAVAGEMIRALVQNDTKAVYALHLLVEAVAKARESEQGLVKMLKDGFDRDAPNGWTHLVVRTEDYNDVMERAGVE